MSLHPAPPAATTEQERSAIREWGRGVTRLSRMRLTLGIIASVVLLGSLLLANWVTTDYGFIPVGFGFEATAGTVFAGFSLAARDAVQDSFGRVVILLLIVVGTIVSFAISAPEIAVASAAAFFLAELLNFAVYTPIRNRARFGKPLWGVAVVSSNFAGAVTDTVVFLGIAFGAAAIMPALPGQLVGKAWATLLYLVIGVVGARIYAAVQRRQLSV